MREIRDYIHVLQFKIGYIYCNNKYSYYSIYMYVPYWRETI